MLIVHPSRDCNPRSRHRLCKQDAAAERLAALRYETFIARCQLAKAHDGAERELLAGRLDLIDAKGADLAARLRQMGGP